MTIDFSTVYIAFTATVSIILALALAGWIYTSVRYHQIMARKHRLDREMVKEFEARINARNAKNENAE